MRLKMAFFFFTFSFIPVYVLLRLDSVQDSTGEASRGEVKVDAMHPGVFVQLQHFLDDLHTHKRHTGTNSNTEHLTVKSHF